jgi:hypothetical protein
VPESSNIFSIGREPDAEDQLTEMLVWLVRRVPEAGLAVVRLALGISDLEVTELEASTQYGIASGRLDALLTTPSLALVVESKLASSFHDEQLGRYLDWLAGEHPHRAVRGLMTLTKRAETWDDKDTALAEAHDVVASARRWEDLHGVLAPIGKRSDAEPLAAQLVQEFLDMLSEEGLIPVKPLAEEEMTDTWVSSEIVISRYHDYFRACVDPIAKELGARADRHREFAAPGYIWRGFKAETGQFTAIGLNSSDVGLPVRPKIYLNAPIVWLEVEAERLASPPVDPEPPRGWKINPQRWSGERPRVWQYLHEVVGTGTFEEQSHRLAEACAEVRAWLSSIRPETTKQDA